jgi:lysyl-tRNA synthetase class 2
LITSYSDSLTGEEVSIAGRIHTMRASGEKLRFYDLYADGQRIQILANAKYVDLT